MSGNSTDPDSITGSAGPVLAVMAREPQPGAVKTRLTPPLSPAFAARLYAAFLGDVLESCAPLVGVDCCCLVHPASGQEAVRALAPKGLALGAQEGADLAARMAAAVTALAGRDERPVLLRNSDSPSLPGALVEEAARVLATQEAEVVLGPDHGGGYYLVGLARPCPELFQRVPMSTDSMYAQTLALARTLGLRVRELPVWLDVDEPKDLWTLALELAACRNTGTCPRTREALQELAMAQRSGHGHGLLQPGATLPPLPDVT